MAEQNSVTDLTKASVDRLYVVNQIRDIFRENTKGLMGFGFKRAFLFGSTMKGTAEDIPDKKTSDIDICMTYKPNKPIERRMITFWHDRLGNAVMHNYIKDKISLFGTDLLKVPLELSLCNVDLEELDEEGRPFYAQDGILIWEAEVDK